MTKFRLDNKEIKVAEGTTVIEAARKNGCEIPSMCYREGKEHFTSCMVCMVKDRNTSKLLPACSTKVTEGMDIISMDEEVHEARKTAIELLLSEHVGDCEAPCQITCPAHMDIPQMNRLLAEGKFNEALQVVKQDIALPAVFGRICPAPCEGACRRKPIDGAVSICLLKRYAGDEDLESGQQWQPVVQELNGKKIAVIGAGPAGLSAAYYLALRGYKVGVYDRRDKPGGTLWKEVEAGILPEEILESEIELIRRVGVSFQVEEIDQQSFDQLELEADAILLTTGSGENKPELSRDRKGTFVAGSASRHSKLAIRALGQGKEAAFSIDQFCRGEMVIGEVSTFNSRFGKLLPDEVAEYMKEASKDARIEPNEVHAGFSREQVIKEASRCLHCDCRDLEKCKLRLLADEYEAKQKRFWSADRKLVEKQIQQDLVIYEPSKCIKCGICVQITAEHQEEFGMSFIGRGFDVVIGVPFNESIGTGLKKVANEAAEACPTGAICNI